MKSKKNGFTLVELLAVIVILAIILVIAVPKIMNVIKDTTKASLESSAKMVAAQVENQYTVAQTLGKEFGDSGSCMEDWAGLNDVDYTSCTYKIKDGNATVTIEGKGKFNGLNVCNATRSSATATEEVCNLCVGGEANVIKSINVTKPYEVKNYESCVTFMTGIYIEQGWEDYIDEEVPLICSGNGFPDGPSTNDIFSNVIDEGWATEIDLVKNNVIKGSIEKEKQCATDAECFTYENGDDGIIITGYDTKCGLTVKVPNSINNTPVIAISEGSFAELDKGIEGLYLPSSISYVGEGAFFNYPPTLKYINLENQSAQIGRCAFGYLYEVLYHNLPSSYECRES